MPFFRVLRLSALTTQLYIVAQPIDHHTYDDISPVALRPPEKYIDGPWNEKVDIWTFGCLVVLDFLFRLESVT